MNNKELKCFMEQSFGTEGLSEAFGQTALRVSCADWLEVAGRLREGMTPNSSMLVCLSAVDRGTEGFELFAHLRDVTDGGETILTTLLQKQESLPAVESLCSLWEAAELFEDEVFDLFGIYFKGHFNLRRIMLDDEFEGYPLRKEYKT